jgi:hypothetical protein
VIMRQGPTWEAKEERRAYGGDSQEQAASQFHAGVEEAIREGYTPVSIEWAADSRSVTVIYEYDPDRAPRPL